MVRLINLNFNSILILIIIRNLVIAGLGLQNLYYILGRLLRFWQLLHL